MKNKTAFSIFLAIITIIIIIAIIIIIVWIEKNERISYILLDVIGVEITSAKIQKNIYSMIKIRFYYI